MAEVHTVSIGVVDYLGGRKTIPMYIPATVSIATLDSILDTTLNAIDDTIDGVIADVSVNFARPLPSGLKTSAVSGKDVHNGANLTFDPADTEFAYSIYFPTWEEAGFAGQTVLTTGVYDTLQDTLISDNWTDRAGNTLETYTTGARVRRK